MYQRIYYLPILPTRMRTPCFTVCFRFILFLSIPIHMIVDDAGKMKFKVVDVDIFTIACFAIALRAIVSLHSYSGAAKPPMYGDYEAQRHWQEVTINLAASEWYTNSPENDLMYWGLDYPPLTAYHSYIIGAVGKSGNESFVELGKSRGIESEDHKSFMRLTVLFADIFLYIPAMFILAKSLQKFCRLQTVIPLFLQMIVYPGQILIDNGHFQYNNISLALAALAISSILNNHFNFAALFFTLALNYKQMELYHALPVFVYLLRVCVSEKSFIQKIKKFVIVGSIVILTFIALWLPWLNSLHSFSIVINRLFPIGRGVFEDKVANVWCAINVVYKLKQKLSNQQMALLCLCTTMAAVLPINIKLFIATRKDKFLYCLTNTAMAFFLFSFQVHEKSILLVALPAFCLFGLKPLLTFWFLEVTVFSMLPLFIKDNLIFPFMALMFIFHICIEKFCLSNTAMYDKSKLSNLTIFHNISTVFMIMLIIASIFVPAPLRYPFLWSLLISIFSCAHFCLFFIFGTLIQFS